MKESLKLLQTHPKEVTVIGSVYADSYRGMSWQTCVHESVSMDLRPVFCSLSMYGHCSIRESVYRLALFPGSHAWEGLGTRGDQYMSW